MSNDCDMNKQSQVAQQINDLRTSQDKVSELILQLEGRLCDVLREPGPHVGKTENEVTQHTQQLVKLAETLNGRVNQEQLHENTLNSILERLEI